MIRQGEIYWVNLGEPTESGPGFRHPHVVEQNNVFKRQLEERIDALDAGRIRQILDGVRLVLEPREL